MTYHFFRKERSDVFKSRVVVSDISGDAYRLKTNLIFRAKNADGHKLVTIEHNGQAIKLNVSVTGGPKLLIKNYDAGARPRVNVTIDESDLGEWLQPSNKETVEYQALKRLFETHAKSSHTSPLISGCMEDNFAAGQTYSGCKMHLELKTRQPVKNPFVSGNEREYFLLGQVVESDCSKIRFLGEVSSKKNQFVEQIVYPSSKIPRPPPNYVAGAKAEAQAKGGPSRIPVPIRK